MEHATPAYDVIVDCGRITAPNAPWPILARADAILLLVDSTLVSVSAAVPVLAIVRRRLGERADRLGLVVREGGPYRPADIAERIAGDGNPVFLVGSLPNDMKAAQVFTHGGEIRRGQPLVRATQRLQPAIAALTRPASNQVRTPDHAR